MNVTFRYENLKNCQRCKKFLGMSGTFVRCGRVEDTVLCCVAMPANWLKGFSNDDTVVHCNGELTI
jgi:hypothetical protein